MPTQVWKRIFTRKIWCSDSCKVTALGEQFRKIATLCLHIRVPAFPDSRSRRRMPQELHPSVPAPDHLRLSTLEMDCVYYCLTNHKLTPERPERTQSHCFSERSPGLPSLSLKQWKQVLLFGAFTNFGNMSCGDCVCFVPSVSE